MLISIDQEIKRTMCTMNRDKWESIQVIEEPKEEIEEMSILPQQMLVDYCRKTDARKIFLWFQSTNPVTFDIKNFVF